MRKSSLFRWGLGLLVALAACAEARTIYVVTTGSDTIGDGSASKPYRTIQKGLDRAAESGDTVQVAAGMYRENLVWDSKNLILRGAGDADGDGHPATKVK